MAMVMEKEAEQNDDRPAGLDPAVQKEMDKSKNMIEDATRAARRLEEANAKKEALLAREERLMVERSLGGEAEVNVAPKEEAPEDYARRVMANDIETKAAEKSRD